MDAFAIRAFGLGKHYRLRENGGVAALAAKVARGFGAAADTRRTHFWALQDVSFDIRKGEVVGIIGHNGAGKSTLLKILTRITNPTTGRAQVTGRVGMLLEVGTGFHEDLTGRENVYLGGAILGMTRAEIQQKYADIVSFAEMDDFMDLAVRHYSSGMKLRLALSVAIHLDAELIFLDEIWAVGDHAFQVKTWSRIEKLIASGRTFVIVAHNLETIARLCTRCLLLDHGRLTMDGPPDAVIDRYRQELRQRSHAGRLAEKAVTGIDITDAGLACSSLPSGEPIHCHLTVTARLPGTISLGLTVRDGWGQIVACGVTDSGRETVLPLAIGPNRFQAVLPAAFGQAGSYDLLVQITHGDERMTTELPLTILQREVLIQGEAGQDQVVPALPVRWEMTEPAPVDVRVITRV